MDSSEKELLQRVNQKIGSKGGKKWYYSRTPEQWEEHKRKMQAGLKQYWEQKKAAKTDTKTPKND